MDEGPFLHTLFCETKKNMRATRRMYAKVNCSQIWFFQQDRGCATPEALVSDNFNRLFSSIGSDSATDILETASDDLNKFGTLKVNPLSNFLKLVTEVP